MFPSFCLLAIVETCGNTLVLKLDEMFVFLVIFQLPDQGPQLPKDTAKIRALSYDFRSFPTKSFKH